MKIAWSSLTAGVRKISSSLLVLKKKLNVTPETFNTSSPPSISSPTSSQEEAEIDELFETSSPDTEPPHFVEMLTASKMGTYPISISIFSEYPCSL